MDEEWKRVRVLMQKKSSSPATSPTTKSSFPEPDTMNNQKNSGPINSPAVGWSLESLGKRMIEDQKRGCKKVTLYVRGLLLLLLLL
jgi:hypothetical protein